MDNNYGNEVAGEASHLQVSNSDVTSLQPRCGITTTINTRRSLSRRKETIDITARFRQAASALGTGRLVKDEYFTLFEAVGALEIMDPKMDSGFLALGESLEDDYDVLQELLPQEVVGIMDQLLCSEMTWHMGHPLLQTLFTSLYVDRLLWPEPKALDQACFNRGNGSTFPNPLLNVVLRAFCLAMIKACDYVHRTINQETFYEEEDFVSNLYNRSLLSRFELPAFINLLDGAIKFVEDQENSLSKSTQEALVSRLKFRKSFLQAVAVEPNAKKEKNVSIWNACSDLLPSLMQSHPYGQPVLRCFSEKIQRRLASTVPPRPIVSVDFTTAYGSLQRLCQDGKDVAGVLDCRGGSGILTFILTFQSRTPQPSVYMRCLLQSLIFNNVIILGRMSIKQLVFDDLAELVLPADILVDRLNENIEVPSDRRFQIAERMDTLVSRVGQSYLDIFRALSMNRPRMRRMLCHTIVDWDNIQIDVEELDVELQPYTEENPILEYPGIGEPTWSFSLSSWAYYQKLIQIEWIVQMGFELHIYQTDEFASMYWYLRNIVEIRQQHLTRIYTFSNHRKNQLSKPSKQEEFSFSRSFSYLQFASTEALAMSSFADSLSSLYKALSKLKLLVPSSSYPYSTSSLRHALRMSPFITISIPPVPSEAAYVAAVSPLSKFHPASNFSHGPMAEQREIHALLACAETANRHAKAEWDLVSRADVEVIGVQGCASAWKTRVKDVQRSVIAAGIAIAVVKRWLEGGGEMSSQRLAVEVMVEGKGKAYHAWWIVPRISAVTIKQG